jgi:hypothetical protein
MDRRVAAGVSTVAQNTWTYLETGTSLTRAYVRDDGAVCTAAGVVIDDVSLEMLCKTRRAVDSILGETDLRVTLSHIAMVGPSGAPTLAGAAIASATGLNAQIHTLEDMIRKFNGDKADAIIALVEAFYADEVEAAA